MDEAGGGAGRGRLEAPLGTGGRLPPPCPALGAPAARCPAQLIAGGGGRKKVANEAASTLARPQRRRPQLRRPCCARAAVSAALLVARSEKVAAALCSARVRRIFQAIDVFGRVVAAAIPARVVGGARIRYGAQFLYHPKTHLLQRRAAYVETIC
jgi:hypothetical protein